MNYIRIVLTYCNTMRIFLPMKTFVDLIDRWGIANFADAIDVDYVNAQVMRYRNSVNGKYFKAVVADARKRGWKDVDLDVLHGLKRGRNHLGNDLKSRHQNAEMSAA